MSNGYFLGRIMRNICNDFGMPLWEGFILGILILIGVVGIKYKITNN